MFWTDIDEEGGEEDDTPKPDWKPPPVIPKEENRTGTNKRTFFVATERRFFFNCHQWFVFAKWFRHSYVIYVQVHVGYVKFLPLGIFHE